MDSIVPGSPLTQAAASVGSSADAIEQDWRTVLDVVQGDRTRPPSPPRNKLLATRVWPLSYQRDLTLRSWLRRGTEQAGPAMQFARKWLLAHQPIGDAATTAWEDLWARLSGKASDRPVDELSRSLLAACTLQRDRDLVAWRERTIQARKTQQKDKESELHLLNMKRRRRLLKLGVKVGPPRKHFWGSTGSERMDFLEQRSRVYARRRTAKRMAERLAQRLGGRKAQAERPSAPAELCAPTREQPR